MRQKIELDDQIQTPWQRLRSLEAIAAIKSGKIRVPLACGWCDSPGIVEVDSDEGRCVQCIACGRLTKLSAAHSFRRQKLRAIIAKGIDPDLGGDAA